MRVSSPSADVTTSTSPPGSCSLIAATMFANEILIVTYALTEILVSSALTMLMRATAGSLSTTPL